MPSPLVSIITPAYKAEAFIGDAVRSALAQTHPHWEMLIVSDDGKDYQTILAQQGIADTRLKFFSTGAVGSGPSRGRNIGLKAAKGEMVALLDADDTWAENYLTLTALHALAHGMVITRAIESAPTLVTQQRLAAKKDIDTPRKYGVEEMDFFTHGINAVYKRSCVDCEFHEGVRFGEDFIFNLQVVSNAGGYYYEPAAHYYYSTREGSLCKGMISDEEYLQCKTRLWEDIKKGAITVKHPRLHKAVLQYMEYAVSVERSYHESKAREETTNFPEFQEKNSILVPMFPEYFAHMKEHDPA